MQERKHKTTYLLSAAFAVILVVVLVSGMLLMRNSLMKMTIQERTNQLEEMVTQIQAIWTAAFRPIGIWWQG